MANELNKEDRISASQFNGWIASLNAITVKHSRGNLFSDSRSANSDCKAEDLTIIQNHLNTTRQSSKIAAKYPTAVTIGGHDKNHRIEVPSIIKSTINQYEAVCAHNSHCASNKSSYSDDKYVPYNPGGGGGGSGHSGGGSGGHNINGCARTCNGSVSTGHSSSSHGALN